MAWANPRNATDLTSPPEEDHEEDEGEFEEASSTTTGPSSPPASDIAYPSPTHILAIKSPHPKKDLEWVQDNFGINAIVFRASVNAFLRLVLPPRLQYLTLGETDRFDFWTRIRLFHPTDTLPTLDDPVTEVLLAQPAKSNPNGRITSPASGSTALLLTNPNANGIARYRPVRIRAVFKLTSTLGNHIPYHLAFIELFSPPSTSRPRANLKQYTITPSKHANGMRMTSVVPLNRIKMAAHLTPHFNRMGEGDWNEDLLATFSHFYLNDFSSHLMYGYMHIWQTI